MKQCEKESYCQAFTEGTIRSFNNEVNNYLDRKLKLDQACEIGGRQKCDDGLCCASLIDTEDDPNYPSGKTLHKCKPTSQDGKGYALDGKKYDIKCGGVTKVA